MTLDELAAAAGVTKARISKWKSEDKWEERLKKAPKKKGGQRGNKNAAGRTPKKDGNKNAVTHGAFAQVGIEDINSEKAEKIKGIDRAMKIEAELNRLHGRIIKQIDSIKSYEMEERRLRLEERKYHLAKQKLTGEFEIDDETEEIIDDFIDE